MTTDCSTTGRTAPFLLLCSEECFHPICFDSCKIFKKTHPEQRFISGIYLFEVLTGIVCAFITKCYGVIEKTRTFFFRKAHFLSRGRHPLQYDMRMPLLFTSCCIARYPLHTLQFIPQGAIRSSENCLPIFHTTKYKALSCIK
jgi:hypothetical protein